MPENETEEEKLAREEKERNEQSKTPNTPTSDTQKDSRIDALIGAVSQLVENVKSQNERFTSLETRLTEQPKPKAEITEVDFFKEPEKRLKQSEESIVGKVERMLKDTVAPLQKRFADTDVRDARKDLKDKYRNDPKFKVLFDKGEQYIDQALDQIKDVTDANVRGTLYGILGAAKAGDIPIELDDKPKPKEDTVIDPPTRRPSAPPRSSSTEQNRTDYLKQEVEKLDENERFLAKKDGLTLEQYVQWRDENSMKVATSKIGKEDKKA